MVFAASLLFYNSCIDQLLNKLFLAKANNMNNDYRYSGKIIIQTTRYLTDQRTIIEFE